MEEKKEKYFVQSHTFMGTVTDPKGEVIGYKYEITFNRSLVHTGRFTGIAQGLDEYERREIRQEFTRSFGNVWHSFKRWVRNIF